MTTELRTLKDCQDYWTRKRVQYSRLWKKDEARRRLSDAAESAAEAGLKLATVPRTYRDMRGRINRASDSKKWTVILALRAMGEHDRIHDATVYAQAPYEGEYDEGGNHLLGDNAQKAMPWGSNDSESGQCFFYVPSHRLQEALDWFKAEGVKEEHLSSSVYAEDGEDRSMIGCDLGMRMY